MNQKELFEKIIEAQAAVIDGSNNSLASVLTLSTDGQVVFEVNPDGTWKAEGEIQPIA